MNEFFNSVESRQAKCIQKDPSKFRSWVNMCFKQKFWRSLVGTHCMFLGFEWKQSNEKNFCTRFLAKSTASFLKKISKPEFEKSLCQYVIFQEIS